MIQVTEEDTFQCILRVISNNICKNPVALDFASGSNPGGSWRSKQTGTQEESLCRRSNLGLLLEKEKYPIERDGLRYIKKVTITHDFNGPLKTPVYCGIIASELRGIANSSKKYLKNRIDALYNCAIKNKHDLIVLGAWGCGAFKETDEDTGIIAELFFESAFEYKDKIKTIFAIKGKYNYKIFHNYINHINTTG
ncbi:Domain of unknown function (DUF2263)-containing protein [uncultured virus]|nr:Domain of unknown function (DUF2263)-containing protein [uncultured virus]